MPRKARTTDPLTSHLAAASTTEEHLSRLETYVWGIFRVGRLELTDEELVRILENNGYPASPQGIRTARVSLERRGFIEVVGEAKTRFGRKCRVFAAK
jgi:hypothetical protein